ncbi:hypothetical protein CDO73_10390 [Saccharibacillus sp. O23]|nr:hypothetical protein CDO73_10390 [Saccharibacillus sp. O23]
MADSASFSAVPPSSSLPPAEKNALFDRPLNTKKPLSRFLPEKRKKGENGCEYLQDLQEKLRSKRSGKAAKRFEKFPQDENPSYPEVGRTGKNPISLSCGES